MRKLWLPAIALILLVQCKSNSSDQNGTKDNMPTMERTAKSDTSTLLQQYWILSDAENPQGSDVIEKHDDMDFMPGIVFITDGGIVANPAGKIRTGTYTRTGTDIQAKYSDNASVDYVIELLSPDSLRLKRTEGKNVSTLHYYATNTWWPNKDTNPFTVDNLSWTIKPKAPETDDQIKKRVEDYLRFIQYYLEGYARGSAEKISFVGIPNVLQFYPSAMSIAQDGTKLNKKWVDCFYNNDQAQKAYQLLRHILIMNYNWDKNETNWIKQTPPVMKDMIDSLKAGK